jgi:AcrR family transcriptional regulator
MTDTQPGEPAVEAIILDAARSVLARAGYRGFTIEAVAVQTGFERAVVERRWTSKEELLVDVFAKAMTIEEIPDLGDSRQELSQAVRYMIFNDWYPLEPALFEFAADRNADQAAV